MQFSKLQSTKQEKLPGMRCFYRHEYIYSSFRCVSPSLCCKHLYCDCVWVIGSCRNSPLCRVSFTTGWIFPLTVATFSSFCCGSGTAEISENILTQSLTLLRKCLQSRMCLIHLCRRAALGDTFSHLLTQTVVYWLKHTLKQHMWINWKIVSYKETISAYFSVFAKNNKRLVNYRVSLKNMWELCLLHCSEKWKEHIRSSMGKKWCWLSVKDECVGNKWTKACASLRGYTPPDQHWPVTKPIMLSSGDMSVTWRVDVCDRVEFGTDEERRSSLMEPDDPHDNSCARVRVCDTHLTHARSQVAWSVGESTRLRAGRHRWGLITSGVLRSCSDDDVCLATRLWSHVETSAPGGGGAVTETEYV